MIEISKEKLIRLEDIGDYLPSSRKGKKLGRAVCFRWAKNGARGAVLETIRVSGARYTSLEKLQVFIDAQNPPLSDSGAAATSPSKPPPSLQPKGASKAAGLAANRAGAALAKLGIK